MFPVSYQIKLVGKLYRCCLLLSFPGLSGAFIQSSLNLKSRYARSCWHLPDFPLAAYGVHKFRSDKCVVDWNCAIASLSSANGLTGHIIN